MRHSVSFIATSSSSHMVTVSISADNNKIATSMLFVRNESLRFIRPYLQTTQPLKTSVDDQQSGEDNRIRTTVG